MLQANEVGLVMATVSKHAIGGIIALVIGVIVFGLGLVRAAIRTGLFLAGVVVILLGVLLVTRVI